MNPKITIWDTNKAGGWDVYEALTHCNPKFREVSENLVEDDPDKIMNAIDKELTKVKFIAFGKVKAKSNPNKKKPK